MPMPFQSKYLHSAIVVTVSLFAGCSGTSPSPEFEVTDEIVAQHNLGVATMGRFEYADARVIFKNLVDKYPQWDDVKIDLAVATLNRNQPGDTQHAADLLDTVIARDPANLRAKYCRAILYMDSGDSQNSKKLFEEVATADPSDAYALYYAGKAHADSGNTDEALRYFLRAKDIDPYLRSAYYGALQAFQRLGNMESAQEYLEAFQRLEGNPQARLAETKYTRMGPRATLEAIRAPETNAAPLSGPVFQTMTSLKVAGTPNWRKFDSPEDAPSITVCDLNADRRMDLFIAGGLDGQGGVYNAVLLAQQDGSFVCQPDHSLSLVPAVNAALWGDFNNDAKVDVYLCRTGANQLWQQMADGDWADVTTSSRASGGDSTTLDGAVFDADHDGDLDYFLLNENAPDELLSNNLDGTFRPLAKQQGLTGHGTSRGVVLADLDRDRDVDIVVIADPESQVHANDRLWEYHPATRFEEFRKAAVIAAAAADMDVDGQPEIVTATSAGLSVWTANSSAWSERKIETGNSGVCGPIAVHDVNGDGRSEIICGHRDGWMVVDLQGENHFQASADGPFCLAVLDEFGYSVVTATSAAPPSVWYPDPAGRHPLTQLTFTGKESKADQMRTNVSGIGVDAAVRVGRHWSAIHTFRSQSGVGQSLQPVPIGLRGRQQMDYLAIRWPDGLLQTELGLEAGRHHVIEEVQRQVSSCPMIFAWNGERFEFVTDILGVAGIGFNTGRGQYSRPRPWENLLLPSGLLHPREGKFVIKIGEPMEESMYLDAARLIAWDIPPGWNVALDERLQVTGQEPSGAPIWYRRSLLPTAASNERGQQVLSHLVSADFQAAPIPPRDPRFLGRTKTHVLTLSFDTSLQDWLAESPQADLHMLFDGWVEYPYSQTMFAAWQANASYEPPTIEARGDDDTWHVVWDKFGYMAGMPRQASVPIPLERLPSQTRELRISTNLEIYWDRIKLIAAESNPTEIRQELTLQGARVAEVGFARREKRPQMRPYYNYQRRVPLWDTRHQAGNYSALGNVMPLLDATDDALAIIGPGEEIQLEFENNLPPLKTNWQRRFILECDGWCKDRDLFTRDGDTLAPIPQRNPDASTKIREELHRRFNRRYRDG